MERYLPAMPKHYDPLPIGTGYVGGIESLLLDGRRYYFGFNYGSDVALSQLIDDPEDMAAFASEHMSQSDGKQDAAFWNELVAMSVDVSDLVGDEDALRTFTTEELRGDLPEPDSHLLYLLGAATEWEDWYEEAPEVQQAYKGLGFDADDSELVDTCLAAVREHGVQDRPAEWTVVRYYLTTAAQHAPGNWSLLFGPVAEAVAARG